MARVSRTMASHRDKREKGHAFPVNSPSFFFEIVTELDLQAGKELPEAAVRKFGNFMGDSIFLKVPNCTTPWEVELKKTFRGSRMWLQKGWEEFAEFYSIDQDYFIVFKYEGHLSHFRVHIYHSNQVEISYPLRAIGAKDSSSSTGSSVDIGQDHEYQHDIGGASNIKYKNPSFRVTMTQFYISGQSGLRINSKFAIANLCELGSSCEVTLQTSGEKTWSVVCAISMCGVIMFPRFKAKGWKSFVHDNNLEVGAICKFELIGVRKLKVYIYQANNFKLKKPSFQVKMTAKYLAEGKLGINSHFAIQNLCAVGESSEVTLARGDNTWKVQCIVARDKNGYAHARFNRAGWRSFVQDNHMEVGDVCKFELTGFRKLKVYICREMKIHG